MTRLSVNINKIATLRNARGGNNPDVIKAAMDCERFGAESITVHPRPDERHIRYSDVLQLKDVVKTEEEFRQKIKEEYERYLMRDSDRFLDHELRHAVLNANPVALPDDFLKRWLMTASEKPITMAEAEHEYMHQAEELRWKLLRDKIVETYQLNITDEEKNIVARQLVLSQFSRYGVMDVPEDKLQELSKQYLTDKKISENINEKILDDKMMQQLKQNVPQKEQEINYDDFQEVMRKHQHEHHHEHEHAH